jgi:UDP-N-acetyl-2-amino-2-deoxyglucuronate dehydrogenase
LNTKNFAITGVGGYVAPRHLQAIKDTGNNLIAAVDPNDSVGIMDRYFPEVSFFTEFERFDRHLEKLRRNYPESKVDFVSICSPNNLHDAHIRFAFRIGADAICEKPMVLNPWNLDILKELETETGKRAYTVLQLRLNPAVRQLKEKISIAGKDRKYKINLTYITPRGPWYKYSWKGTEEKSGGLCTNIGIHFFDLLIWLFGKVQKNSIYLSEWNKQSGFLELENAEVTWYLSIDRNDLPEDKKSEGNKSFRSLTIDGEELSLNDEFTALHTRVYEEILKGNGYGIDDVRDSIQLCYELRKSPVSTNIENPHRLLLLRNKSI